MTEPGGVLLSSQLEEQMSEQQHGPPSPRAEVERYQQAIDYVRRMPGDMECMQYGMLESSVSVVCALAQERVAELSRRVQAAEQDEIAWRGGP